MVRFGGPTTPDWREFRKQSRPLQGLQEIGKYRLYADVRGDLGLEKKIQDLCHRSMA